MSLFSVLKRNSRLALKDNWGKAILVLLVGGAATLVLQIVQSIVTDIFVPPLNIKPSLALRYGVGEFFYQSLLETTPVEMAVLAVFTVLAVLLLAPLNLGTVHWHYNVVHSRPGPVTDMFRFFESGTAYRRSVWYDVNLSVRCLLWALLFFAVPCGIFGGSLFALIGADQDVQRATVAMASVGILLGAVLTVLAGLFFAVTVNRYSLAAYLLCEDDSRTVGEAIKLSVDYTKGYRFSILWYQLSFIGWIFLCGFVFPALYVVPYLRTAIAMYARYIIEKNRMVPQESTKEFVVEAPSAVPPYPDRERKPRPDVEDEDAPAEEPEPEPRLPQEPVPQPETAKNPFDGFRNPLPPEVPGSSNAIEPGPK